MKIIEGRKTGKLRTAKVYKKDRKYIIEFPDIRLNENEILISGYDLNGMYFQIKHTGKYSIRDSEAVKLIYLK